MNSQGSGATDAQIAGVERFIGMLPVIYTVATFILGPLFVAAIAGILVGVFTTLMGGQGTFKQMYAVLTHSGVISMLSGVFSAALVLSGVPPTGVRPPGANLGIFVPMLEDAPEIVLSVNWDCGFVVPEGGRGGWQFDASGAGYQDFLTIVDALFAAPGERLYEGRYHDGAKPRLATAEQADAIVAAVAGQTGEITQLERKERKERAPLLYDLTSLQRDANTRYGFSARRTLAAAQRLYEEHKALTYPRTNSRFLSTDMIAEIKPTVEGVGKNPVYAAPAKYVAQLDVLPLGRVINDAKVTDHHAIIPTNAPIISPEPPRRPPYLASASPVSKGSAILPRPRGSGGIGRRPGLKILCP